MNFFNFSVITSFAVFAVVCVNYAHSAVKINIYKSTAFLGGCQLKTESGEGSVVYFVPRTESKTRFEGAWPTSPGDISMSFPKTPVNTLAGVEPVPEETLTVSFKLVDGEVRPVSYTYDNVRKRLETKGLIQPKSCPSLN